MGREGEGGKEREGGDERGGVGRGWGEGGREGEGRREEKEGVVMRRKGCWHEYARSMVYVRVYMQECPSALCMYVCMYSLTYALQPTLPCPFQG